MNAVLQLLQLFQIPMPQLAPVCGRSASHASIVVRKHELTIVGGKDLHQVLRRTGVTAGGMILFVLFRLANLRQHRQPRDTSDGHFHFLEFSRRGGGQHFGL